MSKQAVTSITIDKALESLPFSFFHYRLIVMCGFAFMADALEVSLLSFLSTCAGAEWNLTHSQKATITSVVFGGTIIGSVFWGQVADRYGRRLTYLLGCILISGAGILSGLSPSYEWLLLFRCIVGFGVGGSTIPFDLIAEFLPPSYRGKYLNYIQCFWTVGTLIVTGTAWLVLSTLGWRALTYFVALPVIITSFFSYIYLPESPRWLLTKGKVAEAEDVVRNAATLCGVNLGAFRLVLDDNEIEFNHSVDISIKNTNIFDLVRHSKMRRISLKLFVVWFAFGFAYYGIILFVARLNTLKHHSSSELGTETETGCSFNYLNMFVNSTSEFVGVVLTILLIDIFGRVKTQGTLYLFGGLACVGLFFSKNNTSMIVAFAWISRMFMMGSSSATWVITPELYPTELRATGHALCNTACRIGAFLSPYFVVSRIPLYTVALGLGLFNFIAAISSYSLPETIGLALDTIITSKNYRSINSTEEVEEEAIELPNALSYTATSAHGLLESAAADFITPTNSVKQHKQIGADAYRLREKDTPPNSHPPTPERFSSNSSRTTKDSSTFHPIHQKDFNNF